MAHVMRQWRQRPEAYGLLLRCGEGIEAINLPVEDGAAILSALRGAGVAAPLIQTAHHDGSPDSITALVSDSPPLRSPFGHLRRHMPDRPLPLPAAETGGHAVWLSPPSRGRLPSTRRFLTAIEPLYVP